MATAAEQYPATVAQARAQLAAVTQRESQLAQRALALARQASFRLRLDESEEREGRLEEESEEGSSNLRLQLEPLADVLAPRARREALSLQTAFAEAAGRAAAASERVRALDAIRERIKDAEKKVKAIVGVKECLRLVQRAMDAEDYDTAALHITKYLRIDESVLEGTHSEQLKAAEHRLKAIVTAKLEEAVRASDEGEVLRYCVLFSPLGMQDEGLQRYSQYLRQLCERDADELHRRLAASMRRALPSAAGASPSSELSPATANGDSSRGADDITCVDACTRLFENIAAMMHQRCPIVESKFGPGSSLLVVRNLQAQADVHASKVLDLFIDSTGLSALVESVSDALQKQARLTEQTRRAQQQQERHVFALAGLSSKDTAAKVLAIADQPVVHIDTQGLVNVMERVCLMSQSSEFFSRFVRAQVRTAQSALDAGSHDDGNKSSDNTSRGEGPGGQANEERRAAPPREVRSSELERRTQELMANFVTMADCFLSQSLYRALEMDEVVENTFDASTVVAQTSSVVDNLFFVLQKCFKMVLSSCNVSAVCAVINLAADLLTEHFAVVLESVVNETLDNAQRSASRAPDAAASPEFAVVLNNIRLAGEYISKLQLQIGHEAIQLAPLTVSDANGAVHLDARIKSGLEDLGGASSFFASLLQRSVEAVWSAFVQVRIKRRLAPFADERISYVLSELNFAEAEIQDPFVNTLIEHIDRDLATLRAALSPGVFQVLLDPVASYLAAEFEREIHAGKKFNQFGGLQLEKELRVLQQYLSSLSCRATREKFSRLQQIASLLSLDSPMEALDLYGPESSGSNEAIVRRLSARDVKRVLLLRVDFDRQVISKLELA